MNKISQNLPYTLLLIFLLVFGFFYLFSDSMNLYPAHVHSWTQSDRLAIAMRFQENDFDLFHPSTYNLLTKDGITQVDFPIHEYLIAFVSKVSGINIVSSFRWYNLLYAFLGLFFLYRTSYVLNRSGLKSILLVASILTLPFYAYYINGFLPSIPSFANFCIGLYFLVNYFKSERSKSYALGVLFFSLAALSRIPFTIFLFALILERIYSSLRSKKFNLLELALPLLGIILVFIYFRYNQKLADEYGNMFLSQFRYPNSWEEFKSIFSAVSDRWAGEIIGPFHWALLGLVVFGSIVNKNDLKENSHFKQLKYLGLISLTGVLVYFFLMGLQFIDHDYYYIDSFLPVFVVGLLLAFSIINIPAKWYVTISCLSLIIVVGSFSHAASILEERYAAETNGRSFYTYGVYERAVDDKARWGIQEEDTLAFFDISSTNIPFTLFKNRGYTSLNSGKKSAQSMLNRSFDYALLLDSFKISDSYFDYPAIAKHLKWMGSNGELSFYKRSRSSSSAQFFENLIYQLYDNFESPSDDSLTIVNAMLAKDIDSRGNSLMIDSNNIFTLTTSLPLKTHSKEKDLRIAMNFDLYPTDSLIGMQYILAAGSYYFPVYLESEINSLDQWQKISIQRRVPSKYIDENSELKVYFWNPKGSKLYIDNYHLIVFD